MDVEFDVVLEEGDSGDWIASVPSLNGCHTQGRTREEALERIHEAIDLCLEYETPRNVRVERITHG